MAPTYGNFVWYDLITTDAQAAKAFYTDLMGWKTTRWSVADYEMWNVGEQPLAGLVPLSAEARKVGLPPHWLAFINVDDVDTTLLKAEKLGGKMLGPATDIPATGRFAVVTDPQGAAFAIFKPMRESPPPDRRALGHFGWSELNTSDWKAAWSFYSELFRWKGTRSIDMGPAFGAHFMFGMDPEVSMGGISNAATTMNAHPHWLHFVNVKNTDDTAKRIIEKGGKVLKGPAGVPGGVRVAQCMDSQGAVFGLYSTSS